MTKKPVEKAALLIGVIAFAIRLKGIHGIDLGLDGGLSLALAGLPVSGALDFLAHDVHPPLFYLLLRPWIAVVGSAPFAAKFLGVTTGTLAVVALFGWTRSFLGSRAALVASLLLAVSPVAVEVDLTVREYSLAILLLLLAAWAASGKSGQSRARFAIAGIFAVWTSYLALTLPFIVALSALARRDMRRWWESVAICAAILPWLAFATASGFLTVFHSSGPRQQAVAPVEPLVLQLRDILRMLNGGLLIHPTAVGPVLLMGGLVLLVLGYSGHSVSPLSLWERVLTKWLLLAVLNVAVAIAVNTFWTREGLGVRYVAPALPFLFTVFGYAVDRSIKQFPTLAALALGLVVVPNLAGTVAWYGRPTLPPSYWDPTTLVAALDARTAPNDAIVFVSAEQAGYYEALSKHPRPWILIPAGTDYLQGNVAERAAATLPHLSARSRVIWFVVYRGVTGEGTTKLGDWLSLHAFAATPATVPDSEIDPYLGQAAASRSTTLVQGVPFANNVRLIDARFPTAMSPGGVLPIQLRWRAAGPLDRNLKVFIHLTSPKGDVVSQHDSLPENARAPSTQWGPNQVIDDRHGLFVSRTVAPGDYWLEIGLYDDHGRLPLQNGGDTLRLGPIRVAS